MTIKETMTFVDYEVVYSTSLDYILEIGLPYPTKISDYLSRRVFDACINIRTSF